MNQREKMLVGGVLCLAVLFVGKWLYGGYTGGLSKQRAALETKKQELHDVKLELEDSLKAKAQLTAWQEQSLPNNPHHPNDFSSRELAFSLYSKWLGDTLDKSGLKPEAIDKLTAPVLTSKIGSVGVSVRTAGSLTALVEFLHKFYSSAQLHQITRLDLTPSGNNLTIKLQVEALMLPGAVETDALPKETVNPFKLADLSAYRVAIGGRDIFKPYTRPTAIADRGSTPPVEGEVDAARFAFFSGATLGTKGMLAWINVRTTGETILASEGDPVNVGQLKSKVLSIEQRSMVFETDGKKMQVEIGKSLRDAKQIGTVTTEKADNEAAASGS